jgi:hypothetical protein
MGVMTEQSISSPGRSAAKFFRVGTWWPSCRVLLAASWPILLTGCATPQFLSDLSTPSYAPSNVHRDQSFLPTYVRRVAVLPLTTLTDEASMDFGRDSLWPVLLEELGRSRQFELVAVPPEELRLLTGRSGWSGEEKLPADFFEKLKDKLGVDAVLFSRLTQYRAYEPLAVGWRLKLLDAEVPRILWAVDEVFDARVAEVSVAARRYARDHPDAAASLNDPQNVLLSPRRFGQYTTSAVVATMPGRLAEAP